MDNFLIFQSDFGLDDAAVSAMYGVALTVDPSLRIFNATHGIEPYNVWEASYRLFQNVEYWPEGSVFVSVCDPGVGSHRKSVVARTKMGHYIVTPDNGTLTHISKFVGIEEGREIEETTNRRENTQYSYTFHGRDVYAYTGARLAAKVITFEEVGPLLDKDMIIELPMASVEKGPNYIKGSIDILDIRFGSIWTNILREDFVALGFDFGDKVKVEIYHENVLAYKKEVVYGRSFADVQISDPVLYVNSLYRLALALNRGNFAKGYNIGTGNSWTIKLIKE